MSRIRIKNKRVTNGRNVWHVTATISPGIIELDLGDTHGDINDMPGILEAIQQLMASKPRYARAA